jgi:K+-sensing histidine kinase KdpD
LSGVQRLVSPKFLLVAAISAGAAFVLSVLCREYAMKAAVPVIFLPALVPVAHLSGRMAGLIVAIVASFIFATYLFEPYGSLAIHSGVDRIDLLCFGLAAIGVVRFSPGAESRRETASDTCPGRTPRPSSFEGRGALPASDLLERWIAILGYAVVLLAIVTLLLYIWN